jgi:hypothetical protein
MPRTEFDTDAVGRWSADTPFPVPAERTIAYAKATNDPIAVLSQVAPDRPEGLKRLAVRFSAPGRPGQVMTTSIWREDEATLRFESVNNEGQVLIKDGLAEFEGN